MDKKTAKELCFRYFEGTADFETENDVRNYLLSEENLVEFRSWEKEWESIYTPTIPQINSFNRIRAKISKRRRRHALVYVASVAAVVMLGLVIPFMLKDEVVSEPKVYVVETSYQERTKVILPDSTQVWLNSASCLSYTDDFLTENRQVEICGEAFFDVTHHNTLPFVVKFGNNVVTVKGTKFNVTAYSAENKVYAALLEGAIEFTGESVQLNMNPGEILAYDLKTKDMLKYKTDVSSCVTWMNGKLDYSSITLEPLLIRLSSIYGFNLHYNPQKYSNYTFRIKLSTNESLADVLDAISLIIPIRWTHENGTVTVIEK